MRRPGAIVGKVTGLCRRQVEERRTRHGRQATAGTPGIVSPHEMRHSNDFGTVVTAGNARTQPPASARRQPPPWRPPPTGFPERPTMRPLRRCGSGRDHETPSQITVVPGASATEGAPRALPDRRQTGLRGPDHGARQGCLNSAPPSACVPPSPPPAPAITARRYIAPPTAMSTRTRTRLRTAGAPRTRLPAARPPRKRPPPRSAPEMRSPGIDRVRDYRQAHSSRSDDVRIDRSASEQRADTGPRETRVAIHRIIDGRQPRRGRRGRQPHPRKRQERAHQHHIAHVDQRPHGGKTEDPRSALHPHQERLRDVIPVMGGQQVCRPLGTARIEQQPVARASRAAASTLVAGIAPSRTRTRASRPRAAPLCATSAATAAEPG